MSGVATAIAGAAIVGGVVQNNASKRATKSAEQASAAELEFAKQQYADWQKTFGNIEDTLATYYETLTPDTYASMGLQAAEKERSIALERINQNLAQRGLTGSGLEQSAIMQTELGTAEQKATVRANAPAEVAKQQLSFLSLGYGQNPQGQVQNVLSGQADSAQQIAQNQQIAAGEAIGSAITTTGTAIADYIKKG